MRAMEYTPAPPPPEPIHPGRYAECWEWDKFEDDLERQRVEEKTVYYKHLTDAECAAELWREHALWTEAFMGLESPDPEVAAHSRSELPVARDRSDTWHRFATHQHASEVEA